MPALRTHVPAQSGRDHRRDLAQGLPGLQPEPATKGRDMTATAHRAAASKRLPVYDSDGRMIATVDAARSVWLSSLLSECPHSHIFLLPEAIDDWATAGCPRCRLLGLV